MDLQALIDGMAARGMRERSASQMTLGKLIDVLEKMPPDFEIDGIEEPHSYRGYYSDLAFQRTKEKMTAGDALKLCRSVLGETFEGYKGGDYDMGKQTPVWIAWYGSCGDKFMSISESGKIETEKEEW